ncbi:MAG: hypothetical protein HYV95_17380 [Opitutae bacterium]|nr:hypothetical protein [Opitutae bacterium]
MSTLLPPLHPRPASPLGVLAAAIVLNLGGFAPLGAQPAPSRGASLDLAYSYSGAGEAEFGHGNAGKIRVGQFSLLSAQAYRLSDALRLSAGIGYEHFSIDADASLPVPDALRALTLDLSLSWQASPEWSFLASARPGLFSDGASLGRKSFNSPVLVAARRQVGSTLTLMGGLYFNSFADQPVLPVLGLNWAATPRFSIAVGIPRTEAAWDLGERRSAYAGASFRGGAFHTDDPAVAAPVGQAGLRDTEVTYREIRLGAGVRWPLSDQFTLELEAGWAADRRFDYNERGLTVKIDGAPYAQLGISGRF